MKQLGLGLNLSTEPPRDSRRLFGLSQATIEVA